MMRVERAVWVVRWGGGVLASVLVPAMVLGACGSDDAGPQSTAVTSTSSTINRPLATPLPTLAPPPTAAPTSPPTVAPPMAAPATTVLLSTTVPVTTTTVPAGAALILRDNSVGDAVFGADPDDVVAYIRSIIGAPTSDSGWVDPTTVFGVCPGTEVRGVSWGDLRLLFSDESTVIAGRRHFFTYTYGPAFGSSIDPTGPRTATGISVGSTVADVLAAYPDVIISDADEFTPANFFVSEDIGGFLSGTGDGDTVVAIIGGRPCGE